MDAGRLAVDARSLESLRARAGSDPKVAVREAASEFEALFTRQLLKSMRDAMPRSGLMDGPGQDMYLQMYDDQLARGLAGRPGGLGDMIARHLSRYIDGGAPAGTPDKDEPAPGGAGRTAAGEAAGGKSASATVAPLSAFIPVGASASAGGLAMSPGNAARELGEDPRIVIGGLPQALRAALGAPIDRAAASTGIDAKAPFAYEAARRGGRSLADLPDEKRQMAFIRTLLPHAQAAQRATGVPAEFVLGQAALESGWGRGEMRHPDGRPAYNLFGIKATGGWEGRTVDVSTAEYIDGKRVQRVERFRAYDSYAQSFADWVELMQRQPRYAQVLARANTPAEFAQALQSAGYATDPRYGEKLESVIHRTIGLKGERS